jgi:hypothetical protein
VAEIRREDERIIGDVYQTKRMFARSPYHGQGGESLLGNLKFMAWMLTAMLLRNPEDETKHRLEDIKIASIEEIVEMLERVV